MPDLSDLIAAAVVRPGDYLVVGLPEGFGTADCDAVLAMLREQLPGVNPMVLGGITGLAVRPANDKEPPGA